MPLATLSPKFEGVHPKLIAKVLNVMELMAADGHPMFVVVGLRTAAEQAVLYAKGRTAPGHIVTNADGVIKKSNHQMRADGYGWAVDVAFQDKDPFSLKHPWSLFGQRAEAEGLVWGGRFKHPVDLDHVELKDAE